MVLHARGPAKNWFRKTSALDQLTRQLRPRKNSYVHYYSFYFLRCTSAVRVFSSTVDGNVMRNTNVILQQYLYTANAIDRLRGVASYNHERCMVRGGIGKL